MSFDPLRMIERYQSSAISYGDTQRSRDFSAGNEFADELERLGKQLRDADRGQQLLRGLLQHPDPYVRVWAAKDCLAFAPDLAISALEELGRISGVLGTTARTTLSEWRAGRLFKKV